MDKIKVAKELLKLAKSLMAKTYFGEFAEALASKGWTIDETTKMASKSVPEFAGISLSVNLEETENTAMGQKPTVTMEIDSDHLVNPFLTAMNLAHLTDIINNTQKEVDSLFNRK